MPGAQGPAAVANHWALQARALFAYLLVESESSACRGTRPGCEPKVRLTSANAGFVGQICSRLEAFPWRSSWLRAHQAALPEQIACDWMTAPLLWAAAARPCRPTDPAGADRLSYDLLSEKKGDFCGLRQCSWAVGPWMR